jgi:hypothetical protein
MPNLEDGITYAVSPPVTNEALNALFGAAWPKHRASDFMNVLMDRSKRSLLM